ncbi:MAG: D-glucuronyl C5-epimerase family protein [Candidatus Thorarchaeota archaeon]
MQRQESLMSLRTFLNSGYKYLAERKSKIVRRFIVYILILVVIFPFVFINRNTIYSTFILRHDKYKFSRTSEGLVISDYGYQAGVYVGEQITVRTLAEAAVVYYSEYIDGNLTALTYFNNCIDYILTHLVNMDLETNNGTVTITTWPYDFAIWDLPVGWRSGMVDAMAIHALALAHSLNGNTTYLDIIERVINAFEIPIAQGGNLLILENNTYWYPEIVVTPDLIPDYNSPLILNGFQFALIHMYQANEYLNNSRLANVFNLGVEADEYHIHKYDLPYKWTRYHLRDPLKLASASYHAIHIAQTELLYEYTNETIFKTYHELWSTYTTRPLFTWEEIFSWEFIQNGLLMLVLVLMPIIGIDIAQSLGRSYLRKRKATGSGNII